MPMSPMMAPEAPIEMPIGAHHKLTAYPKTPVKRYITTYLELEKSDSTIGPTSIRHHRLKPMWMMPAWRNTAVTSRHHWPAKISGHLAPRRTRTPVEMPPSPGADCMVAAAAFCVKNQLSA